MRYRGIKKGRFISRTNRFAAEVELEGEAVACHVKNTGRCRELLLPGAQVFLEESGNAARKTRYDLVAVYKDEILVNVDSQAPNAAAEEWMRAGAPGGELPGIRRLRREVVWGNSRFDLFAGTEEGPLFVEVKGVTLEKNGTALFPDAPTLRGVKHVEEMTRWVKEGGMGLLLFVIQMRPVLGFAPNMETHPEFGEALARAKEAGVRILAMDCQVLPDSLNIGAPVPVHLPIFSFHRNVHPTKQNPTGIK